MQRWMRTGKVKESALRATTWDTTEGLVSVVVAMIVGMRSEGEQFVEVVWGP